MNLEVFLLVVFVIGLSLDSTVAAFDVSLNQLLSTCVHAARLGCEEIRQVERKRQGGASLSVELKDLTDPRSALTEADEKAQQAIVGALKSHWGEELVIVGEEDDDDTETIPPVNTKLEIDLCASIADKDVIVPLDSIRIFVDPVDGTREFVEGRLQNCQALVGIAVDGESKAGVLGIPFPSGALEDETTIIFGQVDAGNGILGPSLPDRSPPEELSRPLLATGDASTDVMVSARKVVQDDLGGSSVLFGGAGNKVLATALGTVDCTVQHNYGGPWDTCAPEAILRSMGGTMTDLNGDPLIIHRNDSPKAATRLGFVGTSAHSSISHEDLISSLKTSASVQEYIKSGTESLQGEE